MTTGNIPKSSSASLVGRVIDVASHLVADFDSIYTVRELTLEDTAFYDDRSQRIFHGVASRPHFLRLGVVSRAEPGHLLASFIASVHDAKSHTLTIHRTQSTLDGMDPAVADFLVEQLLLAADLFGYSCGAAIVRVHDVGDKFFQQLLESAGFTISKKNGFLFATRRIDVSAESQLV